MNGYMAMRFPKEVIVHSISVDFAFIVIKQFLVTKNSTAQR